MCVVKLQYYAMVTWFVHRPAEGIQTGCCFLQTFGGIGYSARGGSITRPSEVEVHIFCGREQVMSAAKKFFAAVVVSK